MSSPNNLPATENTGDALALPRAIQTLFQPLARMLVRQGVGAKSTLDYIKRAYVAATIDVLKERDLPITPARLSIFTGLAEREILQITQDLTDTSSDGPTWHDAAAVVLMTWHVDPRFTMAFTGTPAELEINENRERPSFRSLVMSSAPNANPAHLLEQLVRAGAVQINPDTQRVQAVARAYIHEPLSPTNSKRLGKMVRNYTETLYSNTQTVSKDKRRFDRNVVADFPISPQAEQEFRALVYTEAQSLLELLDKWLQDQTPEPEGVRVGVGVFQYLESDAVETVQIPRALSGPSTAKASTDAVAKEDDIIDVLNYKGPRK